MPTSNTSSPVKRPGLGRRAVSSHAVVTRTTSSSTQGDLAHSHSSSTTQKAAHRPHRPHLVGGGRNHHRNPSFGKNLNKLQRHQSSQQIVTVAEGSARLHQRKKSAPATPAASPRGHHVRWDGLLDEPQKSTGSMKKNYSSPALRRNPSGVLGKKALVTDRPHTSSGKKKTVGFELADSDNDDADWEDTTQSPESTRRSSVAQSKDSVENPAVLVDPLTFVKRSYPQFARATSLPESTIRSFGDDHLSDDDDDDEHEHDPQQPSYTEERHDGSGRAAEHADIAARLLSLSHSAKAPPAMSSISATVKPTVVDSLSRNASLTNLASGHDGARRPLSSSQTTLSNTPGNLTHATSSSIEGGVSKFIINNNKAGAHAFDSDPNTPSSFLPHYHPQTPPSPNRGTTSRKARASPPSRPPGTQPHSRTQQKLWLQRTAALNTSPPDGHGGPAAVSPATIDPSFIATTHARPGVGPFETGRTLVNGSTRASGTVHDNESKHVRKAYEKTALELTVVRRFQTPSRDSFNRLNIILNNTKGDGSGPGRHTSLSKPIQSAPALTHLQDGKQQESSASPEPRQLIGRRQPEMHTSASQNYLQDPDDLVNESADGGPGPKSQHPSHRILSTSDEPAQGNSSPEEIPEDPLLPNETEMMIRRIWDSREVAIAG
ncbi:hypothetical protein BO70DRAFT_365290 [Aspergillus heteromorphus CBS 117.55]|uniref:Uncharacterized protein n=1 Tax=Aspergillus heteromorphus CBS 117.55 TaxID=1448321 RepID=A0A317V9B7_9EURO|nr:uncharacterized protein BO70DRAFT_365290 [Aspergillus heteromorphus CBS 117.55]PWY70983.1 hypothetical protein BO70DRAFT_365290 [Aspergillus heteromorphus CBS 117.55]